MKRLVYNEIKLFLSKKNIVITIIGIILMVVLFQFNYVKNYREYPEMYQYKLQEEIDNATVWSERVSIRLERLLKEYPGHEDTPEAELEARTWKSNLAYLQYLQRLWENSERNEVEIKEMEKTMDDNLIPFHEQGIEVGVTGLYKSDERDWNSRILLRNAYNSKNTEEPLIPIRPDGGYLLSDALNGISIPYLIIMMLLILWNFNIWSADFENETARLIFTLPYSKSEIYLTRFITRFLMSLMGILICLLALFLSGYIKFGSGLERWIIVNQKGINNFKFFNLSRLELLPLDKAVSIKKYLLLELVLFIPYILMLYTIIQFVSFLSKNQMISLIMPIIGLIVLSTNLFLPKESYIVGANIFLYMQTEKMFSGALGIGLPLAVVLLFVVSSVFIGLSIMVLNKREN